MRPLRFVPAGGSVVEVTVRTHQSQFLLRPSPALNEIVVGVLGRAQAQYPVRCHAAVLRLVERRAEVYPASSQEHATEKLAHQIGDKITTSFNPRSYLPAKDHSDTG